MRFRRAFFVVVAGCVAIVCGGCSSGGLFTKESLETRVAGVLEDSTATERDFEYFEAYIDTFVNRAGNIHDSVTTYEDLTAIGLNPEAKNIVQYRGPGVLPYILGTNNPQIQISKPEELQGFLNEYNHYLVVEYELKNIKSISDAVYFSTKETETEGSDMDFVVILKDGVVIKHYFRGTKDIDATKAEATSGGGFVETLRGARDIAEVVIFFFVLKNALGQ